MLFFSLSNEQLRSETIRLGHRIAILVLLPWLLMGCQRLQLPAIDPNGRCLFLPLPNTTQLAIPPLHSRPGEPGFLPSPAFQSPSAPPPCLDGNCEPAGVCNLFHRKHQGIQKIHDHFRSAGKAGELQLTPMRIVAPVGGEVVLLAGICGQDGYLVKREPLEWMLSPESVGQIIQVNDDAPGKLSSLLHPHRPKVEKLDVDFAKGRTSAKPQIIDRGTPNCDDDIHLREGETWISISSPTQGTSRITALAPESDIWDRRRKTAVIYWVDAQWEFPNPQIVKADQRALLRTKVTKAEGLVPASGWLVQYTIVDPNIATFAGPPEIQRVDDRTVRSVVDASGFAYLELAAVPGAMGTTAVVIEVISPAQPEDNIPALTVGRGQSFVTFSSAGLQLQVYGPEVITQGDRANFSATLANPGDINAENTRLIMNLPPGLRYLGASLEPSALTDAGAVWDQGVLPANRQLDVSFTAEAIASGTYEVIFQGEATGVRADRKAVRFEVVQPTVELRFAPAQGKSQAEVGEIVPYEIDLTNTGRQSLTNLKLMVQSSAGMVEASQGDSKVELSIPQLQPGETRKIGIPFRLQQEGEQQAVLRVLSGGVVVAEKSASVLGLTPRPRQPNIGVEIQLPGQLSQTRTAQVGVPYKVQILLRNAGEMTLTNPNVQIATDASVIQFFEVDTGNRSFSSGGGGSVLWSPPNLLPGEGADRVRVLWLTFVANRPATGVTINVQASSAEGVQASTSTTINVVDERADSGLGAPPASSPPPSVLPRDSQPPILPPSGTGGTDSTSVLPPVSGRLNLSITDFRDPEVVGATLRYALRVSNNSDRDNRRTQIQILVSEGAELLGVSYEGSTVSTTRGIGGAIKLPELAVFRRGEELVYTVYIRAPRVPQQMSIQASVLSDLFTSPVSAVETTTILPAN